MAVCFNYAVDLAFRVIDSFTLAQDAEPEKFREGVPGLVLCSRSKWQWDGNFWKDEDMRAQHTMQLTKGYSFWGTGSYGGRHSKPAKAKSMDAAGQRLKICAGSKVSDRATDGAGYSLTGDGQKLEITFIKERDPECQCCDPDGVLCGIAPGWGSDLCYYTAQYHPVLGICLHSPSSRFNCLERIATEFSVIMLMVCTSKWNEDGSGWREWQGAIFPFNYLTCFENPYAWYAFNILFGMLVWDVFYYVFTQPCYITDPYDEPSCWTRCKFCGLSMLADWFGYIVFLIITGLGVLYLAFETQDLQPSENDRFQALVNAALFQRGLAYLLFFVVTISRRFSLCCAWGVPDPRAENTSNCLRDCCMCGAWRIEKQRFQNEAIRGFENFAANKKDLPDVTMTFNDLTPEQRAALDTFTQNLTAGQVGATREGFFN